MIAIDNVLLSDEIIEEEFVCDLTKCKGGCCVDGDCGAPLTEEETHIIARIYPHIKPCLDEAYIPEIERQGTHTIDSEYGYVTPTVNGGICVYGYTDETGTVKCGIEKAWREGLTDFRKPISCHLYPIRITSHPGYEAVNYEPRPVLCKPACKLGRKLKVPVYKFLKEPLIRKYGEDFYNALDHIALKHFDQKDK
ncbi:DUF3109 family protein [Nemorincola caseinilytica]|uniref:DUF3109 family protein n=1 Tax=Nemorincola caseinilytica TaxID=2054315 RepID=A0ABP8NI19_9BACT